MKKFGLIFLTLCLFLSIAFNAVPAFASESSNKTITNGTHTVDGATPLLGSSRIVENVESAMVFEVKTQTLMYAYNADAKIYPASFAKILTALIVSERANFNDSVTITGKMLSETPDDGISTKFLEGEVLTVEDLLHCMMVDSDNDAATILAEYVSGSQAGFVEEMNQYALELGCTQTNFTNVHGLHDEMQYTTARDMTRILAKAVENEKFSIVFGATSYTVPKTNLHPEERNLTTGNFLMSEAEVEIYFDERATGSRTGVTASGSRNIATSAQSNGMQMICVVSGASDVIDENSLIIKIFGGYNETSALLDAAFDGFEIKQIVYSGQAIEQLLVENGSSDVVLGAPVSVQTVLPSGVQLSDLDYRVVNADGGISAPLEKGDVLSALEVWHNNICVAHIDLCAMNSVELAQNQMVEIKDRTEKKVWLIVLIVIVVVIAAVVGAVIVIKSKVRSRRRRAYNRRRERRRD